jgi:hypothetical protein
MSPRTYAREDPDSHTGPRRAAQFAAPVSYGRPAAPAADRSAACVR